MFEKDFVIEYLENTEKRIEREVVFERELKISPVKNKCVSIIGPRRAGKTSLLMLFFRSKVNESVYMDLEHSAFKDIAHRDVFEIISLAKAYFGKEIKYVLLDEIQAVEEWERLVRSLLDVGYEVIISGSSSKLLSKEIATQLRGRSLSYLLLPLSFREFLRFNNVEFGGLISISKRAEILKLLKDYLEWGGYPETIINRERREKILREYYDTILYRDFVERFKVRSFSVAEFVFEFCIQNFSSEISISKIVNFVNSKLRKNVKDVVYDYTDKLSDTLSIFFLERCEKSIYQRKSWPRKIYICDLGLASVLRFERDFGRRMENTVFLDLLRRTNKNPSMRIYYWKNKSGYEVDFVVKEGLKIKQLIQVTYANSFDEIDPREWRALLKAYELFKEDKPELIIITWDYEDEKELKWFGKKGKVKFIPLWKWLLLY